MESVRPSLVVTGPWLRIQAVYVPLGRGGPARHRVLLPCTLWRGQAGHHVWREHGRTDAPHRQQPKGRAAERRDRAHRLRRRRQGDAADPRRPSGLPGLDSQHGVVHRRGLRGQRRLPRLRAVRPLRAAAEPGLRLGHAVRADADRRPRRPAHGAPCGRAGVHGRALHQQGAADRRRRCGGQCMVLDSPAKRGRDALGREFAHGLGRVSCPVHSLCRVGVLDPAVRLSLFASLRPSLGALPSRVGRGRCVRGR